MHPEHEPGRLPPLVRRATLPEAPLLAGIHRESLFTALPHLPRLHTPQEDVAWMTANIREREVWLAEAEGWPAALMVREGVLIVALYVAPAHWGQGLGRALLDLAKRQSPRLELWTFQCNARARAFYERQGFLLQRLTDGAGNEEREPDALYAWAAQQD